MPDGTNFQSPEELSNGLTETEVLRRIETMPGLKPRQRADVASAVRKAMVIARAVSAPDAPPPRVCCETLNDSLWRRAPATFGIHSPAAFNNLVSRCRAVLVRLDMHEPTRQVLSVEWQGLYDAITLPERQRGLIRFLRFLSRHGIAPDAVTQAALDRFELACRTRILHRDPAGLARRTAGNWAWARANVPGWPEVTLVRQGMRDQYGLPFDAYPPSFAAEAEAFLHNLANAPSAAARRHPFTAGGPGGRGRAKGTRPATVKTHRDRIRAAAGALVRLGTPPDAIIGLRDLVQPPERPGLIGDFLFGRHEAWNARQRHERRPAHMLGVLETLRQVAKFHCRLPDDEVAAIAVLRAEYGVPTQTRMSDENLDRVRHLLRDDTCALLLHLPDDLLRRAERAWRKAREKDPAAPPPSSAARDVRLAVALETLLNCPIRRANLVNLHDNQILRDATGRRIVALSIPASATKTAEPIHLEVPESLARLLDVWLRHYRPVLAPADNRHIFPAETGPGPINAAYFGTAVSREVEAEIGARFNPHIARHFAVVSYLVAHPGQYAVVARLLGHRKVETTMRFYAGLEADAAARMVTRHLQQRRAGTRHRAVAMRRKRTPSGHTGGGS